MVSLKSATSSVGYLVFQFSFINLMLHLLLFWANCRFPASSETSQPRILWTSSLSTAQQTVSQYSVCWQIGHQILHSWPDISWMWPLPSCGGTRPTQSKCFTPIQCENTRTFVSIRSDFGSANRDKITSVETSHWGHSGYIAELSRPRSQQHETRLICYVTWHRFHSQRWTDMVVVVSLFSFSHCSFPTFCWAGQTAVWVKCQLHSPGDCCCFFSVRWVWSARCVPGQTISRGLKSN